MYEDLIEEAKKEGIGRFVVGAVIDKDSAILLLKRSRDDFLGEIYEIPSGEIEEGEVIAKALHREVEEETGLKVEEIKKYLGHFDYESEKGEKTRQFNFVVTVREPIKIKLQEHEGYVWTIREELDEYLITDALKGILRLFWRR